MAVIFWLASYPKSGNTWLRALLTNYWRDGEQPADINELDARSIAVDRYYFDETLGIQSSDMRPDEIEFYRPQFYREIADGRDPVFIKVHDAYTRNLEGEPLFPMDISASVIYIIRNPLDITISYAHHADKSVDEMIKLMASDMHGFNLTADKIYTTLPSKLLSWSHHVSSWVNEADLNIHIVRYEDMLDNPVSAFSNILLFIGLELDAARIQKAINFSNFESLKTQENNYGFAEKQPSAHSFFHKGTSGSWRESLSTNQVASIVKNHRQIMGQFGYLTEAENYLQNSV